ncbi:folylpolyglutamate synthase, mitochondrial-like isoform X2 [Hydractinia symbiolongicarpus]|uniref:folylpolyglutamate synthase, mitochondrial-like isoform X2 n=1 Tax=Hydractinia symbiolongicarpus TaxID=13093 RepID=UPI00254FC7CB|nr:folylpolyglutamate synthase, mitochondrial-like isoform X2 [Hydractinia symbiolongicarpus]
MLGPATCSGKAMKCIISNIRRVNIGLALNTSKFCCDRSYLFYNHSRRSWFSLLATDMVKGRKKIGEKTYEDAICTLNGLQTNAAVIAQMRKERGTLQRNSLPNMECFLKRLNINVCDLDQLNVIHVSGTKGKGSVSAFCESIMRHAGLQTGFYSSPHLLEVRERIRIGGKPLPRELFAKYFFECYDALVASSSAEENEMPGYFRFLTLMAYYVFLQEQVNVVVLEVGIGGTYDCTNVLQNPVVSGICKLELDHTAVLGDTIEQIAWHKSGIMKPGKPALCLEQVDAAQQVLFDRAKDLKTTLHVVPQLSSYDLDVTELTFNGEHQKVNAALAIQLCRVWFHKQKQYISGLGMETVANSIKELQGDEPFTANSEVIGTFKVPHVFIQGLANTNLYGRCQVIQRKRITFYIDGAHTPGSIEACVNWINSRKNVDTTLPRFVISVKTHNIGFDHAVFCPSILESTPGDTAADIANFNVTRDSRLRLCEQNQKSWLSLNGILSSDSTIDTNFSQVQENSPEASSISTVFPSISSAIKWIAQGRDADIGKPEANSPCHPRTLLDSSHIQVVVTGSLHLVGGVLRFLGPNICDIYK